MWRGSHPPDRVKPGTADTLPSEPAREVDSGAAAGPIALLLNILSGGGAQRRIATLANRFVALGRAVDVVGFEADGPMRAMLSPQVGIVALAKSARPGPLATRADARTLAAYLDRARPAVLMSCVTDTHAAAVIARRHASLRVPLVLRASRDPFRALPPDKRLLRAIEPVKRRRAAWYYARADAVVALSAGGEAGLKRLLGGTAPPIETILNPVVEGSWLDAPHRAPRPRAPVPLILGVGRLVRQKDFATLLRAFTLLRAGRPARLVLLGEGPERPRLAALAARLGIADGLEMPGEVADVAAWLRRADLLVSSSRWEGMQAAPIEALAVGCPVIATDCPGGARDALDDGRLGPLVPVGDARAMATAMRDQLDRPPDPERLARGAARFGVAGKAEAYLALFDRCRDEARRGG